MKRNSTQGHRAPAGGTVAQNGEFYPGGTFLPNTTQPKRPSAPAKRGGRGDLIEPGVFAHRPSDEMKGIFHCLGEFLDVEADGRMVVRTRPDEAVRYYIDEDIERGHRILAAAAAAYNRGERWYISHDQLLEGCSVESAQPASGVPR